MVRIERFGDVTTPAPPADADPFDLKLDAGEHNGTLVEGAGAVLNPAASSTEPGGESDSTVIWVVGGATVLALAALFGTWGDG